jgi:hypothetical protein
MISPRAARLSLGEHDGINESLPQATRRVTTKKLLDEEAA